VIVMLALVAASIFVIGYAVGNFSMCGSRVVKEFPSPDGRGAAIVGIMGCGATGPDTSFVMIRRPDKKFDIAGDDYFFAIGGVNDIEVVWEGATLEGPFSYNNLTVIYKRPERNFQERILRLATVWGTDRISYREK
jgi:hypothetical protein